MAAINKKLGMSNFWDAKKEGRKIVEGKRQPICRLIGQVTGKKVVDTQFGTSVGLTGMFEGTNLSSGEVLMATTAYVPDVLLGLITPNDGDKGVQFAVDIFAKYDEKSPVGFSYEFEQVIETADPLQALRSQIAALPAPAIKATAKK